MTSDPFKNEIDRAAVAAFAGDAAPAGGFTIESIRAEASARRYLRLQAKDRKERDLILALTPPYDPDNDDFLVLARMLRKEGIPVPAVLANDGERGWYLLEDGGARDLADLFVAAREPARREELLRCALDLMISLHALSPSGPAAGRRFDYDKLWSEMRFLFDCMGRLRERYRFTWPVTFELEMFLQEVCDALDQEARQAGEVFTHRDYHTRNILAGPQVGDDDPPAPVLIDFQDARRGACWYDLASLLWDPYTELTAGEREFGYRYYLEKTGRGGKRAHDMYYAQALQRIFKALGTYLFQVYEKNAGVYYPSIGRALERLEEIAQRGFFPDSVYLFVRQFVVEVLPTLPAPASGARIVAG